MFLDLPGSNFSYSSVKLLGILQARYQCNCRGVGGGWGGIMDFLKLSGHESVCVSLKNDIPVEVLVT